MSIPFVDLGVQHREVEAEVRAGIEAVLASTAFVLGPAVSDFEREFADFSGVAHCVGVANGTDALELGLRALELEPGGEVIVPANTFVASVLAIVRSGLTPVLVDVDPTHYLVDVEQVKGAIGSRTRAIMPVHLYGQLAPMDALMSVADEAGLAVIEDAAQCQGARQNGRGAASFGRIAGTSFYPGKNLGAYGDAGGVLTDDAALADKVKKLRNYGSEVKYHHPEMGFNSRLDTIQAVVLLAKLKRLARWNQERREAADRYAALLADAPGVVLPGTLAGNEHVWHLYVVRVPERDRVLSALNEAGIGAGIHYPVPVHLQGAFSGLGHREGDFPVTERAASEILSLPLFPGITEAQQVEVATQLRAALG